MLMLKIYVIISVKAALCPCEHCTHATCFEESAIVPKVQICGNNTGLTTVDTNNVTFGFIQADSLNSTSQCELQLDIPALSWIKIGIHRKYRTWRYIDSTSCSYNLTQCCSTCRKHSLDKVVIGHLTIHSSTQGQSEDCWNNRSVVTSGAPDFSFVKFTNSKAERVTLDFTEMDNTSQLLYKGMYYRISLYIYSCAKLFTQ